jgi:hypothetical protein
MRRSFRSSSEHAMIAVVNLAAGDPHHKHSRGGLQPTDHYYALSIRATIVRTITATVATITKKIICG